MRPGWGAAEWAEGPGGGEPGGVGPPWLLWLPREEAAFGAVWREQGHLRTVCPGASY